MSRSFGTREPFGAGQTGWVARLVAVTLVTCLMLGQAFAKTIHVTPQGEPGYPENETTPVEARPFTSETFRGLKPGDVVQLLPTSPDPDAVTVFTGWIKIENIRAGASPVFISGLKGRTRIVGRPLETLRCPMPILDIKACANGPSSRVTTEDLLADALRVGRPRTRDLLAVVVEPEPPRVLDKHMWFAMNVFGSGRLEHAACIDLFNVEGLILEKLDFRDCWLAAVRARKGARKITLRDSFIVGSSFGLAVRGREPGAALSDQASDITVERVKWIQDASGYEAGDPAKDECLPQRRWRNGCPGDMWRRIPWGVTHHASFEHFNGALLGGRNLAGNVIFKGNRVSNAYNGIRLTAKPCAEELPPGATPRRDCPYNAGITISGNHFSYIRDNPIELEQWATDAVIGGNDFHNSHAWLSFDGMGGGPVFVFGNTGWFDDRPSLKWASTVPEDPCVRDAIVDKPRGFDAKLDRRFDYESGEWSPIGVFESSEVGDAAEMQCTTSTLGRVLKFSLPEADSKPGTFNYPTLGPVYVFNNSWYLRAPLTGAGAPANLRHWNNAILFCQEGLPGYDQVLCDPKLAKDPTDCGRYSRPDPGLDRYAASGLIPFFECFRWLPFDEAGKDLPNLASVFDWDVSSIGFPRGDRVPAAFERQGRQADPGFIGPERGEFKLREGAAAARSGCRVEFKGDLLACVEIEPALSFAGAFAPDGKRYEAPFKLGGASR